MDKWSVKLENNENWNKQQIYIKYMKIYTYNAGKS